MQFMDRRDAGKQLATKLAGHCYKDTVILALPRGGVVLSAEIAKRLSAPLGVVLVRKIGHPASDEYAIGAVAEDAEPVYNRTEATGVHEDWLQEAIDAAHSLNSQRRTLYYRSVMPPEITDKTVLLVDDGMATGLSMEAAIGSVRKHGPRQIIVAVPVAPTESAAAIKTLADDVIVLDDTEHFLGAIGAHYEDFEQVSDEEVVALLRGVQHDTQQLPAA